MLSVTAITEVFPDGQRVTMAAVEYGAVIDNASITAGAFQVRNRTITNVYANTAPERSAVGKDGTFVILELSPEDEDALTFYQKSGLDVAKGHDRGCVAYMKDVKIFVAQTEALRAADGAVIPACDGQYSGKVVNLLADQFQTFQFEDLKYNLFIPKNYDPNKKYPLVQFIHDAGYVSPDPMVTLAQGTGAICWMRPEEQAKHECFVLAPQFPAPRIVEDDFSALPILETDKRLIDYLCDTYSIDRNRLYTTGQSMGCMSSIELNIRYPGFFAASLLISGFWNPETMLALKDQTIWVVISRGDLKAYEYQTMAMDRLERAGADVGRYFWNGKVGTEKLNRLVREAAAEGHRIKYSVFESDSTMPDSLLALRAADPDHWEEGNDEFGNHIGTWQIMYEVEEIRDWLFTNSLDHCGLPSEGCADKW